MQKPIMQPRSLLLGILILLGCQLLSAQRQDLSFWEPADSFHRQRFTYLAGGAALAYTGTTIGLYHIWYKDYPQGRFRIFDDWGEWEHVDKAGHLITAYAESYLAYKGARWTGIPHRKAVWLGAGVGTLLQTTVEVMDGFSERWGFSVPDVVSNTAGTALFVGQELLWEEQRIFLKVSNSRPNYSDAPIYSRQDESKVSTVRTAAHDLYGSNYLEAFIKDYNGMTVWASVNPNSFVGERSPLPDWLNIAVGYGANNVFGAYGNGWTDDDGTTYSLSHLPRQQQWYLSLDIDTGRIPTNSDFLKTVFSVIRFIKIPAPALEWRTGEAARFHWLYW